MGNKKARKKFHCVLLFLVYCTILGIFVSGLKKAEVTAALHTPYLFKQTNPSSNIGYSSSTIN